MMEKSKTKKIKVKNTSKSSLYYFGRVTRDLYKVMPIEVSVLLLLKIIHALSAFAQVYAAAALFDAAGEFLDGSVDREGLLIKCIIYVAVLILPFLIWLIKQPVEELLVYKKNYKFIGRLHESAANMSLTKFDEPDFYDRIGRAKNTVSNAKGMLSYFNDYTEYLPMIFRFVGTVGVLTSFSIWFAPLCILSALPTLFCQWYMDKKRRVIYENFYYLSRKHDYLWNIFTSADTVKELRTMNTEKFVSDKWAEARDNFNDEYFKVEMKSTTWELLTHLIQMLARFGSIVLSIYFAMTKIISVGQFAACIAAFATLQGFTRMFFSLIAQQENKAKNIGYYYDFIDCEKDNQNTAKTKASSFGDKIDIKNVSFAYPNSKNFVIKNANLTINKGERVVIVGENGSGKTTLSKIIAGVYSPREGEVCFDGVNIDTLDKTSLYNQFSLIGQDFVKYKLSLRENIAISKSDNLNDDASINEAIKSAGIQNVAQRLGSLDATFGREFGGAELSGGEWQKIAIARGLFRDGDISILDEPTSALDPLIEYEILSKFIELTKGKTSIIISHRIGLCRLADRIIVMKNGEVIENGSHDELLKSGTEYPRIWEEQAKWYN